MCVSQFIHHWLFGHIKHNNKLSRVKYRDFYGWKCISYNDGKYEQYGTRDNIINILILVHSAIIVIPQIN